MYVIK